MSVIKHQKLNRLGFTLIELLVVVAILGVLTAIILPNMMDIRARARDSKRKAALNELKTALRLYYNDHQSYPSNDSNYRIVGCGDPDNPSACAWGESFKLGENTYMRQLPKDKTKTYSYERYNSGEGFRAWIELENDSDGDIKTSQDRCSPPNPQSNAYYVCND